MTSRHGIINFANKLPSESMKVFLAHYIVRTMALQMPLYAYWSRWWYLKRKKALWELFFNILTRRAIGLLNADDSVLTESTCYLFRKRINEYARAGNENLFDVIFADITKSQCIDFEASGKRIRMDSKLLGSNNVWLSRYELIHETVRLFYKQVKQLGKLNKATEERLDDLLRLRSIKLYTIPQ